MRVTDPTRFEAVLGAVARAGVTITYLDLAVRACVRGPGRIAAVTRELERLIRQDHADGRPLRAAVAVSKVRGGLPAPGFFDLCRRLGIYAGPDEGPEATVFHAVELRRIHDASRQKP